MIGVGLHYHSQDPLTYAAQWHTELQSTDSVAYNSRGMLTRVVH